MPKDEKILFIYPNTTNSPALPNAIAIFAGIVKKHRWAMEYFDTYIYQKTKDSMEDRQDSGEFKPSDATSTTMKPFNRLIIDLQEKIDIVKPKIVAISCMSFEFYFLLSFFNSIKIPNNTLVIIGGIQAILDPDKVVNSGLFDLVCIGEGEEVFSEILINYKCQELRQIKNTYFINRTKGIITKNAKRMLIEEKKVWDYVPDFSLFDDKYFLYPFDGKIYRRYNFETARGCPFNCTYCGNTALKEANKGLGKYVRTRPLESIKNNLKTICKDYKIDLFYFEDECFLSHHAEWLREFVDWYGKEIKKPFIIQTRPETINEERIKLLNQMNAPFFQISLGVESGSENILNKVCNRQADIKKTVEAFDLLNRQNIRTCAFFMIGFPYEKRADIIESIKLCRRIKPTIAIVSIYQPMPGQRLRDLCVKEGFIKGDEPMQTFTGGSILKMPQISNEEIINLRRTFLLYAMLPEEYYPKIEKCEKDYMANKELYNELVSLRWQISN